MTDPTVRADHGDEILLGDLLPKLEATARNCDGSLFDFTGWTSLTFKLDGPLQISGTGAVTANSRGLLTYTWATGETDWPGDYAGIFHGISPSPESKPRTFPLTGPVRIIRP